MCGRYTVFTEDEVIEMREIIKEISIRLTQEEIVGCSGIDAYPSVKAPVVTKEKELKMFKWGFKKWDDNGVIFNARSEEILKSRLFAPYVSNRCIIPARSYYEWLKEGNKPAVKYRMYSKDDNLLYMAGIMRNDEYVIITRAPSENISFIHNRMPLILSRNDVNVWLNDSFDEKLIYSESIPVGYEKIG